MGAQAGQRAHARARGAVGGRHDLLPVEGVAAARAGRLLGVLEAVPRCCSWGCCPWCS